MSRSPARPLRVLLVALAIMGLLHAGWPVQPTDAAGRLLLPDLRMAKPRDVRLVREPGRRLLRFTTIIVNEGRGPMDVVGKRACRSIARCPTMRVRQRVLRRDGTWDVRPTDTRMQYEVGDGHRHWHVVDFEQYGLYRLGAGDAKARVGAKFGFCFFDVSRIRPFGKPRRQYLESGCGTPRSLKVHMGLSGGWSDVYPWDFAGQYVDVTGLARGEYLLCVMADPAKALRQVTTRNDQAWVRLRIGRTGIVVRETRRGSCRAERSRWEPERVSSSALRGVELVGRPERATVALPRVPLLRAIGA